MTQVGVVQSDLILYFVVTFKGMNFKNVTTISITEVKPPKIFLLSDVPRYSQMLRIKSTTLIGTEVKLSLV